MADLDEKVLEDAARRFGTPLYLYSASSILRRLGELRSSFKSSKPLICYALKANPNLAIGRLLSRAGAGAEVVSGGELWLALKAGFPPSKIIYSGVGKTARELREGLLAGILLFNVESEGELELLSKEAARLRRRARIAIRVNPDIDPHTHRHITTGTAADKFGLPVGQALVAFRRAARDPWLEAAGLQLHLGSQIFSAGPYRKAASLLIKLAARLEREGHRVRFLDLGGGFGVPYDESPRLHLAAVAKVAAPLARGGRRLIIEPGRYLVAEAGSLLTRVLYLKRSGPRNFAVLDAGMNDLIRPALYGATHPIRPVRPRRARPISLEAVGPICESADRFGVFSLPEPRPGDLWAVSMAGAYGFSMASNYNGRPRPAEVLFERGRLRLIRRRERYEDLTAP